MIRVRRRVCFQNMLYKINKNHACCCIYAKAIVTLKKKYYKCALRSDYLAFCYVFISHFFLILNVCVFVQEFVHLRKYFLFFIWFPIKNKAKSSFQTPHLDLPEFAFNTVNMWGFPIVKHIHAHTNTTALIN